MLFILNNMGSLTVSHLVPWQEFAPSDEELEAYRKGEEWDPKLAEQRRRLKVRLDSVICAFKTRHLTWQVERFTFS